MYNVLACDDEQIAIDSLKFIFDKNFQGQVNLFTALSGFEALKIVKDNNIDIIFMDINMPGMNGLETISLIMSMKPDTVIVVLSAFDTFQYAQEALNLGAFRYITKPVNRNKIIQTARSAMNQVDNIKSQDADEIQKKLDSVSPMVESDFIYSCIFNRENEDLSPYLEYFNIQNMNYYFLVLELPSSLEENRQDINNRIRLIAQENQKCIMGSFMSNRIFILYPFEKETFFPEKARDFFRNLHTLLSIKINRKIKAGVSQVCTKPLMLSDFCTQAVNALNHTNDDESQIFYEDINNTGTIETNSKETGDRLIKKLKTGDIEGVQYLSGLFIKSLGSNLKDDVNGKWKFSEIEILINAKTIAKQQNQSFDDSLFEDAFAIISSAQRPSETEDFFTQRMSDACISVLQNKKTLENPVIKKVCTYINLHLSSDFSLEDAASSAGVSSFYLSKLFREEMNDTFINYVTELKMEKAARLLRESDMSIKEITAQTGYNDQNYFSKIFKNKYELRPSEYRKMR